MVTAGHSIDSVQGTSAGHRLPAMAFRWREDVHRSVRGTTLASGCPSLAFAGNRWPATRQRWEVFVEMNSLQSSLFVCVLDNALSIIAITPALSSMWQQFSS